MPWNYWLQPHCCNIPSHPVVPSISLQQVMPGISGCTYCRLNCYILIVIFYLYLSCLQPVTLVFDWNRDLCIYCRHWQVENLVAIELAYVNTRHPDFDEARLIYRGLVDDGVDSSDLRKASAHNAMTHGGTFIKQVGTVVLWVAGSVRPIIWTSMPTFQDGLHGHKVQTCLLLYLCCELTSESVLACLVGPYLHTTLY